MPSSQLEVYPQLLLACLAALSTTSVYVFSLLLKLLCEVRFSPWKALSKGDPNWLPENRLQIKFCGKHLPQDLPQQMAHSSIQATFLVIGDSSLDVMLPLC